MKVKCLVEIDTLSNLRLNREFRNNFRENPVISLPLPSLASPLSPHFVCFNPQPYMVPPLPPHLGTP